MPKLSSLVDNIRRKIVKIKPDQSYLAQPDPVASSNYLAQPDPVASPNYLAQPDPVASPNYLAQPDPVASPNYLAQPDPVASSNYLAQPDPELKREKVVLAREKQHLCHLADYTHKVASPIDLV